MALKSYEGLHFFEASTPQKLKQQLLEVQDKPHSIMPGGWLVKGQMFGVWVIFDRPASEVKKKDLVKDTTKVDKATTTEFKKD